MIDTTSLSDADKGRKVIYDDGFTREEGELSSWNDEWVFVRFRGPNGESCAPRCVSFSFPGGEG